MTGILIDGTGRLVDIWPLGEFKTPDEVPADYIHWHMGEWAFQPIGWRTMVEEYFLILQCKQKPLPPFNCQGFEPEG